MKTTNVFNPDLPFVLKDYKGNKLYKGRFINGAAEKLPPFFKVLKWKLSKNPQQKEKDEDDYRPEVIKGKSFIQDKKDHITWLGHSIFYIRINNKVFLTDPCFFDLPFIKRRVDLPCSVNEINNIDYLLISHGHRDHFDNKSYKKIVEVNPEIKALVPLKFTPLLKDKIKSQEAGWYQRYTLCKEPEVIFLPATHWHKRGLTDLNNILWGSFLIRHEGKTIFFAGDSSEGEHFRTIADLFGPIDYCLMPIGAYKPDYLMKPSHLSPLEAITAFNDLKGKTFIPMHYGTYDLSNEPASEPITLIKKHKSKLNGELKILNPGEVYYI